MRRIAAILVAAGTLAACSTETSFREEGGVCYRTREEKALFVITVGRTEVQSVDANCRGQ